MSKETDEELVKEILITNEHKRFGVLYDRYNTKVYHKCLSFAKNSDDAKDMLHDIFLKTFTNLNKFSGRSSFSTWLYSITYNYCVDYARSKSKHRTQDIDNIQEVDESQDEANEKELMNIQSERLTEVLGQISPNNKAILLMKFQDGFSIKEITEMLNLSESAVKMRIKRAKASVVSTYSELYKDEII